MKTANKKAAQATKKKPEVKKVPLEEKVTVQSKDNVGLQTTSKLDINGTSSIPDPRENYPVEKPDYTGRLVLAVLAVIAIVCVVSLIF